MDNAQVPMLDVQKILSGGLMDGLAAATQQGVSFTLPAPGVVLGEHIYIPIIPPLPILPVLIFP